MRLRCASATGLMLPLLAAAAEPAAPISPRVAWGQGPDLACPTAAGSAETLTLREATVDVPIPQPIRVQTTAGAPVAALVRRLCVGLEGLKGLAGYHGPVIVNMTYRLERRGDAWGGLLVLANGVSSGYPPRFAGDRATISIAVPVRTLRQHGRLDVLIAGQVEQRGDAAFAALEIERIELLCLARPCR